MSKEASARYRKPLMATLAQSEKAFKTAVAPEVFATLIINILNTKIPKPRYLAGKEAKVLGFIAILPAALRAKLVARLIK